MLGTELFGIWAALPPTRSTCLCGGGYPVCREPKDAFTAADFKTFSKSLLLPQNHLAYFLSSS